MLIFPVLWPPVVFGCDGLDRVLGHCDWNDISVFGLCVLFGLQFLSHLFFWPHNTVSSNKSSLNKGDMVGYLVLFLRDHKKGNVLVTWRKDNKCNTLSQISVCWLLERRVCRLTHNYFICALTHHIMCILRLSSEKQARTSSGSWLEIEKHPQVHTSGQSLLFCWLRCFKMFSGGFSVVSGMSD